MSAGCSTVSKIVGLSLLAGFAVGPVAIAGPDVILARQDAKDFSLQNEGPVVEVPTARTSRGLITLEGPSGMFINPTSATLPKGTFILNYCVFVPTLPDGVGLVGHGILLSYGVLDWLELGFTGDMLTLDAGGARNTYAVGGPEVRIRLLRDRVDKWWPEVSVGTYWHLGTPSGPLATLNGYNVFVAASKTVPINERGVLKSITFQGGFRTQFLSDAASDAVGESTSERGYGGIEIKLPWNFYAVAEVTSHDTHLDHDFNGNAHVPWAAGLQWRGRNFGCTIAALQNGIENGPGFYFGVGGGLGSEPVRTTTTTNTGVPGATR